jgi:hypothetical protein
MVLQVLLHDVKTVDVEAVVVGFHEDIRPLKGVAGELDWVLCGSLSRLIRKGHVRGALGDRALLTTAGKMPADKIFMVGLGPRDAAAPGSLRAAARTAAASLADAGIGRAAVDLIPLGLTPAEDAAAEIRAGLADGAGGRNLQISLLAPDAAAFEQMSRILRA